MPGGEGFTELLPDGLGLWDAVEDPPCIRRGFAGLEKPVPDVGPASGPKEGALALVALSKGIISAAAVALDDALEVLRHHFMQTGGGTAGSQVDDRGLPCREIPRNNQKWSG